jgi:sialic acid synthase SpsE
MFQEFIELKENTIISRQDPPFLIAEIGLNHNNDLELGKKTIQAAAKSGAQAVKFQTYQVDQFISKSNPDAKFLYDIFAKYQLSEESHRVFQKTAEDLGLIFFSTPLDLESVDFLVQLGVPALKVASGDLVNSELLDSIASAKLPIFLSTGASSLSEVIRALEFLKDRDVESLCLMHCVSLYPTPPENVQVSTIQLYKDFTDGPLGFSDHSQGTLASALAVAMEASVIEKHFTLDKNLDGPDHSISLNPEEFQRLADDIRTAYLMRGEKKKVLTKEEEKGHFWGRRSLYIDTDGKVRSLRPAIHLRDSQCLEAWEYIHLEESEKVRSVPEQITPLHRKTT